MARGFGCFVVAALVVGIAPSAYAGGTVPPDCLQVAGYETDTDVGESVVITASYSHCLGADTFRVVQLWVGNVVATDQPHVSVGLENGGLSMDGAATSCVLGQPGQLVSTHATLDCAATTQVNSGNISTVNWALTFQPASFAGPRLVWYDAKGGPGDPEPRLGWTEVGTFTVVAEADEDSGDGGGSSAGGASTGLDDATVGSGDGSEDDAIGTVGDATESSGTSGPFSPYRTTDLQDGPSTGCHCRQVPGREGPALLAGLLIALATRRRRRPPRRRDLA